MKIKVSLRILACVLFILNVAAGPFIWGGTRAKNLTSGGLTLFSGQTLDYDGNFNAVPGSGFEDVTVASWTTYDDGAAVAPVDCTGGSPATISAPTRTTTAANVAQGTAAGNFAKSAADGQGEGWALDITLPNRLIKTPQLTQFNFEKIISDADYSNGDIRIYVYDVDGGSLITPSFALGGGGSTPDLSTGNGPVRMAFLPNTDNDNYRICVHIATTDSAAYDVNLDSFFIGTTQMSVGPPQTASDTFTGLTFSGLTVTTSSFKGYRDGQWLNLDGVFTVDASAGSTASLDLPSGYVIDTTALTTVTNMNVRGHWETGTSNAGPLQIYTGTNNIAGVVFFDGSDTNTLFFTTQAGGADLNKMNGDGFAAATDKIHLKFSVPIAAWAGSVQAGENIIEYASNSSSTDADDTTSFVYGPDGSQGILGTTALSADRSKRIRFQSAIQPTDSLVLEFRVAGTPTVWLPITTFSQGNVLWTYQNGTQYGTYISGQNATDVNVIFARYAQPTGATFGSAGNEWTAITGLDRWRVKKVRGGLATNFGIGNATSPGLVPAGIVTPGLDGALALQERSATPSDPSSGAAVQVYLKDDKIIFQFNNAGTVRYKYLDLTGTGVTWVHTTTPP